MHIRRSLERAVLVLAALLCGSPATAAVRPALPALTWRVEEDLLPTMMSTSGKDQPVAAYPSLTGPQVAQLEVVGGASQTGQFKMSPLGRLMGLRPRFRVRVNGVAGPVFDEIPAAFLAFSRDGRHYVYAGRDGDRWRVVRDTVAGPEFDKILDSGPVFADSGDHVAYVGSRGGRGVLMLDDVADSSFDYVRTPSFTGVGRHYVTFARSGEAQLPVVDGSPVPEGMNAKFVRVAESGTRVGFVIERAGRWSVSVDGRQIAEYDSVLDVHFSFDPTGTHFGYPAKDASGWHAVFDGVMGPAYDEVAGPWFSRDGAHGVFLVRRGPRKCIVRDGVEGPWFDGLRWEGDAGSSADGEHVLYRGRWGERMHVVMDTVVGPGFDQAAAPRWAPVGARSACRVGSGRQSWLLLDGKDGGERYEAIDDRSPAFSPDGERLAFVAMRGKKWVAVVDGVTHGPFDQVRPQVVFSPDSRHWAVFAYRKRGLMGSRLYAVVDGAMATQEFDEVEGRPVFREDGALEFLAFGKDQWRLVRYHPPR